MKKYQHMAAIHNAVLKEGEIEDLSTIQNMSEFSCEDLDYLKSYLRGLSVVKYHRTIDTKATSVELISKLRRIYATYLVTHNMDNPYMIRTQVEDNLREIDSILSRYTKIKTEEFKDYTWNRLRMKLLAYTVLYETGYKRETNEFIINDVLLEKVVKMIKHEIQNRKQYRKQMNEESI